jgi:hypothetical protein
MAFSDYSTTPSVNVTIAGVNVGEGCPPGNLNNAIRQLMADGKALLGSIPDTSALMPKSGGIFTDDISRQGQGAYLHHAHGVLTDGRVYTLAQGSARPTGVAEGAYAFYYA